MVPSQNHDLEATCKSRPEGFSEAPKDWSHPVRPDLINEITRHQQQIYFALVADSKDFLYASQLVVDACYMFQLSAEVPIRRVQNAHFSERHVVARRQHARPPHDLGGP